MAFGNFYGYPQTYNQGYFQSAAPDQMAQMRQQFQMPAPQISPQQPMQSMIWVSGEQEAMGYLVAPNSAVALWDSSSPTIYLKQADASGKPSIKIYDLVERNAQRAAQAAPQSDPVEYATRKDLEALAARVEALSAKKETAKKATKEDAE